MAIAYKSQGAAVATATSGAALSPLTPAVVDLNDILIAHVWYRDTATTPSTPAGWTLLSGPHTIVASRSYVYGRLAAATDDGVAAAFGTAGGTVLRMAQIFSFSGYVSGTITDVVVDFIFEEGTAAGITDVDRTLTAGQMGVNLVAIEDDLPAPSFSATSGGTGTWTENVAETVSSLGSDGTIGIQTCTATASGNTFTRGAADNWGIVGLTVRDSAPAVIDNRAEVSYAAFEVVNPNNRAEVSWAEVEIPTIPAPEAWFMGDAGTGAAINNDPVPTWSDQSGNGNDATQATGIYQPIYKTNVQNGLPVLDFQDHSYTIAGILDALNAAGGASVFAVWKSRDFVSPVAAEVFYMSTATGTSSRFTLEQRSQADGNQHNLVVRRLDGDAATHLNGPANLTGMPFIISSAVVDLPGNTAKLYRGGAEVASAAPSVGSTFTATNSARAAIGSFDPAGAPPTRTLDGQIGELIFYPRALTTAERQRVETYLVNKWATAVNNRAEVSWAEFEVPALPNRAEVSWAEVEVPSLPNRAEVSWAEVEVPDVGVINNRAEVSWAEVEIPSLPNNRAEVSWAEFEVPNVPNNRAEVSWAELEVPSLLNNRSEVSWAAFEVPDFGVVLGTPQEWAVWYLDTYDHCNVLQHRHYPVNHELEPNMPPGWVRP